MARKRVKTIRIIEPPPPSGSEEIKYIELVEPQPPPKSRKEDVTYIELVEPQPPSESKQRKVTYIELVEPPPPPKSKKGAVTYVLVEPPPKSRRQKCEVVKVVVVPRHILRSLNGTKVVRGQVSETEAEKLRAIPDADELTRLILRFLVDHPDRSFTATEIGKAIAEVGRNKVRLLLTGLGVEYRRQGKVLFSLKPAEK